MAVSGLNGPFLTGADNDENDCATPQADGDDGADWSGEMMHRDGTAFDEAEESLTAYCRGCGDIMKDGEFGECFSCWQQGRDI